MSEISLQSRVVAAPHQMSAELSGEYVILNLARGMYFGLDRVGARIWALLQEPRTVTQIRDLILEEYDVDPERCESDLLKLLEDLEQQQLINVVPVERSQQ